MGHQEEVGWYRLIASHGYFCYNHIVVRNILTKPCLNSSQLLVLFSNCLNSLFKYLVKLIKITQLSKTHVPHLSKLKDNIPAAISLPWLKQDTVHLFCPVQLCWFIYLFFVTFTSHFYTTTFPPWLCGLNISSYILQLAYYFL